MKKISVSELKVGMSTLNIGLSRSEHPFLYSYEEQIRSQEQIDLISNKGFTEVFVETGDDAVFHSDEQLFITLDPQGESLNAAEVKRASYLEELQRASEIYRDSLQLAKACIYDARLGRRPDKKHAETLIENIVQSVMRNNDALVSLCKLRAFDEYTYTHSVNACVISVAFGVYLGISTQGLKKLGLAALFHDIGKALLPKEILNKPGKLTSQEQEVLRQHPAMGFYLLDKHKVFEKDILHSILQHHEKINGTGYPLGLPDARIHTLAQLVSLVEVYDALTSIRVYKPRILANEALKIIYSLRGKDFRPQNVDHFIKWLGIYPVGSFVRLSDGSVAIVSGSNPGAPLYPVVTSVMDSKGRHVHAQSIDLLRLRRMAAKQQDYLTISGALDPQGLQLDPANYLI